MLELKGPNVNLLNTQKQHPGFSAKLCNAIDQVRDYGWYLTNPANQLKMIKQFGCVPTQSKLAVLIGRDKERDERLSILERRMNAVPDVEIITDDKILETQAAQMNRIVIPEFDGSTLHPTRTASIILP